ATPAAAPATPAPAARLIVGIAALVGLVVPGLGIRFAVRRLRLGLPFCLRLGLRFRLPLGLALRLLLCLLFGLAATAQILGGGRIRGEEQRGRDDRTFENDRFGGGGFLTYRAREQIRRGGERGRRRGR